MKMKNKVFGFLSLLVTLVAFQQSFLSTFPLHGKSGHEKKNHCKKHHTKDLFGNRKIIGLPPHQQIGVGIGQTTINLFNYKKYVLDVDPSAVYPYAINLYSNLTRGIFLTGMGANNLNPDGSIRAGFLPSRNGAPSTICNGEPPISYNDERNGGDADFMNFQATLSAYPEALLIIGLQATSFAGEEVPNEPTAALSALYTGQNPLGISELTLGQYRDAVQVMICYLKSLDRPVLIRYNYECDFLFNGLDPELFKNAFRYIKQQLELNCAKNVQLIWHLMGAWIPVFGNDIVYDTRQPAHYDLWYPGDEFVDWVGISYFVADIPYQIRGCYTPEDNSIRKIIYNFARKHHKPVTYSEASPAGLFLPQEDVFGQVFGSIFGSNCPCPFATTSEEIWNKWFDIFFTEAEENRDVVRLIGNYIDTLWRNRNCGNDFINFGDSRLETNDFIREKFFKRISGKPYFQTCFPKFDAVCQYPFEVNCGGPNVICGPLCPSTAQSNPQLRASKGKWAPAYLLKEQNKDK